MPLTGLGLTAAFVVMCSKGLRLRRDWTLSAYRGCVNMKPIAEFPTGKGFADLVYLPLREVDRPALVVELKWNASAEGAIRQIKEKRYAAWVEGYTGDILLVGIDYDKKTKRHECKIESYRKDAGADP